MFKKKIEEAEVSSTHPNPNQDPICAGCNKPINTITVRDEFGVYHNQYCQNKRINK